jgi:hypothetical protein
MAKPDDIAVMPVAIRERFGEMPLLLAGFFGSLCRPVAQQVSAERLVLVGPAVSRFSDLKPLRPTHWSFTRATKWCRLAAVFDWARPQQLPLVVVPGGEHFFHGRLHLLAQIVRVHCA